jgi:hypothetical protein
MNPSVASFIKGIRNPNRKQLENTLRLIKGEYPEDFDEAVQAFKDKGIDVPDDLLGCSGATCWADFR